MKLLCPQAPAGINLYRQPEKLVQAMVSRNFTGIPLGMIDTLGHKTELNL